MHVPDGSRKALIEGEELFRETVGNLCAASTEAGKDTVKRTSESGVDV
jgi:hypothetical protein